MIVIPSFFLPLPSSPWINRGMTEDKVDASKLLRWCSGCSSSQCFQKDCKVLEFTGSMPLRSAASNRLFGFMYSCPEPVFDVDMLSLPVCFDNARPNDRLLFLLLFCLLAMPRKCLWNLKAFIFDAAWVMKLASTSGMQTQAKLWHDVLCSALLSWYVVGCVMLNNHISYHWKRCLQLNFHLCAFTAKLHWSCLYVSTEK